MKYIIPVIAFLLMVASGVLGYGYYRQRQMLEMKNLRISESESEVRQLQSRIQKLNDQKNSLEQENKKLTDAVNAKDKRISQLEKFLAERNLPAPPVSTQNKNNVAENGSSENSAAADGGSKKEVQLTEENSSFWWYLLFPIIVVAAGLIITGIITFKKKNIAETTERKNFICPYCGWEYRTPISECENCKTKF